MGIVEALVLGIIQGLTEFLPVSSSGHIEIGTFLLGVKSKDNLLFSIVVHGATALSTIVVFRKDILELLQGLLKFQNNSATQFVLNIVISIVPVGIVGVFFEEEIEAFFGGKIVFVAFMLLITSILLAFTYYKKNNTGQITPVKALLIGLAQAVAILPGISRSGATISTALLLGVEKEKATRFSFLMVLVPIIGALVLKVKDFIENPSIGDNISGSALTTGFIAAFVAGIIACHWMIAIVKKGKLIYFALYCFVVGSIVLITYLI